jgi:uncharacterized protein (DUF952 family)
VQRMVLHIITEEEWLKVKDREEYTPASLNEEGFIHCAGEDQAVWVANTFYKGHTDLLLLIIDAVKVKAEILYEDTENTGMLFPHIYGPLNLDAVVKVKSFKPDENGVFQL